MPKSSARIDSVLVKQSEPKDKHGHTRAGDTHWPPVSLPPPSNIVVTLDVEVRCAPSDVSTSFQLSVELGDAVNNTSTSCSAAADEALMHVAVELRVDVGQGGLALWYPNNYGAQSLHNLTLRLCSLSSPLDCAQPWRKALGLRIASLIQDPLPFTKSINDTLGPSRTFFFRINGQPIWGKGANDVPSDQFESRVTPALLWNYLNSAKDAHMTMLRVWGGGLFERDEFYEYCDKLGILIYHDQMFSDQIYPWHDPYLATVEAETRYQVRRLSRHASLVLWSLTNELLPGAVTNLGNYQQYADYKRKEQWAPSGGSIVAGAFVYIMGAQKLFFSTVAKVIAETDDSRVLVPTSPSNGWLNEAMLIPDMCVHQPSAGFAAPICNPSNPARGDGHFYTSDPSVAYNASEMLPPIKFCSENGAESWASITALKTVTTAADRWIGSPQMQFRERAGSWGPAQIDWVRYHFGQAPIDLANHTEPNATAFENFLVLSQLATGLGLAAMAQQFRLQKSSVELGATMGHLIWQLQDNWPGQSFGLLNYGGEWKQQLHFVRRAFAPLLVTAAGQTVSGGSTIHLISDLPSALESCNVECSLWAFDAAASAPVKHWNMTIPHIDAGGVAKAMTISSPGSHAFLRLKASCSGIPQVQNDHFFAGTNFSLVRQVLGPPSIIASNWGSEDSDCTLTLEATVTALFVVPSSKLEGRFSDSSFSLVHGEQRSLSFKTATGEKCDLEQLRSTFTVDSLYSLL